MSFGFFKNLFYYSFLKWSALDAVKNKRSYETMVVFNNTEITFWTFRKNNELSVIILKV